MRRIGFGIALLTTVCMLSGCGSSKVELTNEQNDMIAEYIAGALLRYDMRYEEELVYTFDEEIEDPEAAERPETPAPVETEVPPVETEAPGQSGETTAPEVTYSGLNDVMKLDGLEVAYKGGGFYNSYPEENSDYFVIEPGVSNQLLVAEFELSNTSAEEKR